MNVDYEDVCVMWNSGESVAAIAKKYGASAATVRNWINQLRKKGVKLEKRRRGSIDIDVAAINKRLQRIKS